MKNYKAVFKGNTIPLKDFCISITDCHHSTPKYIESGKLVIRNFNIKGGRMVLQKPSFTDESTFKKRTARAKPEEGDLIITREAPMGEVCLIPNRIECCLGQRMVLIKPNPKVVDNNYLLYALLGQYVQEQIEKSNKTGSIVSNLRIPVLKTLEIPFRNLQTQKKIAKVLSDLDAKIELNNRINAELEAMAKLLYDFWFVQFDFPNAEGKPYKSSGGEMVFNEELKRAIPKGWEVKELGEVANITMGQSPNGSSYNDTEMGMVFFQGSTDFGWRFPSIRQYTTEPSRLAKKGDILLSVRAPVGTLNIADRECCIGRGLSALNSKDDCNSYLFYVLLYFKSIFDRRNTAGTTFGSITKNDLFSLKLSYPEKGILTDFNQTVEKLNHKIYLNHQQNQQLSSLRDWLLPMLMNGQVSVGRAEELVGEVLEG